MSKNINFVVYVLIHVSMFFYLFIETTFRKPTTKIVH